MSHSNGLSPRCRLTQRRLLPSDELYIFPLLGKNQSVGVIPGLYGNSNQSNCKTSTNGRCRSPAQDRFNTAKLQGYWDWAATEPRIELIMPWHWADGANSTWSETPLYQQCECLGRCSTRLLAI